MASKLLRPLRGGEQTRRGVLGGLIAAGAGLTAAPAWAAACAATARQTSGPFYPVAITLDDWDLTRTGGDGRAEGAVIEVAGRVLGPDCGAAPGAVVEVWQANAQGRYDHPRDGSSAPLDPNFQGYARLVADAEGRYRFLTVKPGSYAVGGGWERPPHIHYKVTTADGASLTTQMYFAGEPLNDADGVLQRVPEPLRPAVIVDFSDTRADGVARGAFDITVA